MIRPFKTEDIPQLLDIYNYYVLNSTATFDLEALTFDVFKEKTIRINNEYPFIVYEEDHVILGYAYGSKFRPKPAYHSTVESTVYVKHDTFKKQIGTKLYADLLVLLKQAGFRMVMGVLNLPNPASVRLHEKFGFIQVADLKQVGFKFGKWQDVGFWQRQLD